MILDCPACTKKFLVADALLMPAGRTVRCGACKYEWYVQAPEPLRVELEAIAHEEMTHVDDVETTPTPEEVTPLVPGANVPAIARRKLPKKPFVIAAPVLALLWVILAVYAYFPNWQYGPLKGIYRALGAMPTDGLLFDNVHMEKIPGTGGKTKFVLSGSIVNHAATERTVPSVRVRLKNKDGEVLWERVYDVNLALKGGEVYPFHVDNVETSFASSVSTIVLDVGSPMQLRVRK